MVNINHENIHGTWLIVEELRGTTQGQEAQLTMSTQSVIHHYKGLHFMYLYFQEEEQRQPIAYNF